MKDTLLAATHRLRDDPRAAHLPWVVSALLALVIAWQLATITWTLLAPAPAADAPVATAAVVEPPADPARIAQRHLFGRADALPSAPQGTAAPETRLDLTLRGVAASGTARARALIAGPDNKEKVYAIGAEVPGGARVHGIHAEYVLLNRRGTLEILRLPKLVSSETPTPAEPATAVAVDNLRNQAAADQLVEVVRPQAVMVNGELRGFRVYPGRDRQRFAALGLRAGDLVTAVNGVALTDPTQGLEALRSLTSGTEVQLTVQRGDETENVTVTPQ